MRRRRRGFLARPLAHAAMLLVAVVTIAPLLWLVIMSISSTNDLTTLPLRWIPHQLDLSRFHRLLSLAPNSQGSVFVHSLRNTLIVAAGCAAVSFALAVPAAWAFSRTRGRHGALLYVIVATYMLPPILFVVPLYRILASLDLLNTTWALILTDTTIVLPFVTWLVKSGIDAIPAELEQAAAIDGATLWRTLVSVTLPLARPILGTTLLLAILNVWDEFLYALLFTSTDDAQTLTVAIANLATGRITDYGLLAAAGLLAALPPVLIGVCLQRTLVAGLTGGALKG
jgi:multiple sugar transport system permease protein